MTKLRSLWSRVRQKIDSLLAYDPNPEVVIERNGTRIIVSDSLKPEENAMCMSMYSRSPISALVHLIKVKIKGAKDFIAQYYTGYGHLSIGDCGTTNIYFENVSMLCAKAIQQYLLYKGQEASTRYLDMAKQKVLNPLGTPAGTLIQVTWMNVYTDLLSLLVPVFKERFPRQEEEKESVYNRAINARAFDVARAFLPAGATTYVGWHCTLREARVHLLELRHHPLPEVREAALMASEALHAKYPSSGFDKRYPEQERYMEKCMRLYTYMESSAPTEIVSARNTFDFEGLAEFEEILKTRPAKSDPPTFLKKYGDLILTFFLDFGSFRDLQRHRSGITLMPLLKTEYGFHEWYIEQIPEKALAEIRSVIQTQMQRIAALECDEEIRQYYIAMGFKVLCECTFDLPASIWVAELRSSQTVHPTLRIIAQEWTKELQKLFPNIALHSDLSPDIWSIKRGTQTIIEKDKL